VASRRRWWQSWARAWCRGRHRDQRRRWSRWSFGDAADTVNSRCISLQVRAMSPVGAGCSWCSSARMTARKAWARIARVTQRSQGVWRRTWCSSRPARPLPAWKVSSIFQRVPARRTGAAPRRSRSPSSRRRSRRRRGRPARRRGERRRTRADHRGPRRVPLGPLQQMLLAVRSGLTGPLRNRPAVLAGRIGQQSGTNFPTRHRGSERVKRPAVRAISPSNSSSQRARPTL